MGPQSKETHAVTTTSMCAATSSKRGANIRWLQPTIGNTLHPPLVAQPKSFLSLSLSLTHVPRQVELRPKVRGRVRGLEGMLDVAVLSLALSDSRA